MQIATHLTFQERIADLASLLDRAKVARAEAHAKTSSPASLPILDSSQHVMASLNASID